MPLPRNERQLERYFNQREYKSWVDECIGDSAMPDCVEKHCRIVALITWFKAAEVLGLEIVHSIQAIHQRLPEHAPAFANLKHACQVDDRTSFAGSASLATQCENFFSSGKYLNAFFVIVYDLLPKFLAFDTLRFRLLCHRHEAHSEDLIADDAEAIIFFGRTGAGKTTFIHYLLGYELEYRTEGTTTGWFKTMNPQNVDPRLQELMRDLHIGSNLAESETQFITAIPWEYSVGKKGKTKRVFVLDVPGFGDSQGPEVDLAAVRAIISTARKCKRLIPCIALSKKDGGKFENAKLLIRSFGQLFQSLPRFLKAFSAQSPPFYYVFTHFQDEPGNVEAVLEQICNQFDEATDSFECLVESMYDIVSDEDNEHTKFEIFNPADQDAQDKLLSRICKVPGIEDTNSVLQFSIPGEPAQAIDKMFEQQRKLAEEAFHTGQTELLNYIFRRVQALLDLFPDDDSLARLSKDLQTRVQHKINSQVESSLTRSDGEFVTQDAAQRMREIYDLSAKPVTQEAVKFIGRDCKLHHDYVRNEIQALLKQTHQQAKNLLSGSSILQSQKAISVINNLLTLQSAFDNTELVQQDEVHSLKKAIDSAFSDVTSKSLQAFSEMNIDSAGDMLNKMLSIFSGFETDGANRVSLSEPDSQQNENGTIQGDDAVPLEVDATTSSHQEENMDMSQSSSGQTGAQELYSSSLKAAIDDMQTTIIESLQKKKGEFETLFTESTLRQGLAKDELDQLKQMFQFFSACHESRRLSSPQVDETVSLVWQSVTKLVQSEIQKLAQGAVDTELANAARSMSDETPSADFALFQKTHQKLRQLLSIHESLERVCFNSLNVFTSACVKMVKQTQALIEGARNKIFIQETLSQAEEQDILEMFPRLESLQDARWIEDLCPGTIDSALNGIEQKVLRDADYAERRFQRLPFSSGRDVEPCAKALSVFVRLDDLTSHLEKLKKPVESVKVKMKQHISEVQARFKHIGLRVSGHEEVQPRIPAPDSSQAVPYLQSVPDIMRLWNLVTQAAEYNLPHAFTQVSFREYEEKFKEFLTRLSTRLASDSISGLEHFINSDDSDSQTIKAIKPNFDFIVKLGHVIKSDFLDRPLENVKEALENAHTDLEQLLTDAASDGNLSKLELYHKKTQALTRLDALFSSGPKFRELSQEWREKFLDEKKSNNIGIEAAVKEGDIEQLIQRVRSGGLFPAPDCEPKNLSSQERLVWNAVTKMIADSFRSLPSLTDKQSCDEFLSSSESNLLDVLQIKRDLMPLLPEKLQGQCEELFQELSDEVAAKISESLMITEQKIEERDFTETATMLKAINELKARSKFLAGKQTEAKEKEVLSKLNTELQSLIAGYEQNIFLNTFPTIGQVVTDLRQANAIYQQGRFNQALKRLQSAVEQQFRDVAEQAGSMPPSPDKVYELQRAQNFVPGIPQEWNIDTVVKEAAQNQRKAVSSHIKEAKKAISAMDFEKLRVLLPTLAKNSEELEALITEKLEHELASVFQECDRGEKFFVDDDRTKRLADGFFLQNESYTLERIISKVSREIRSKHHSINLLGQRLGTSSLPDASEIRLLRQQVENWIAFGQSLITVLQDSALQTDDLRDCIETCDWKKQFETRVKEFNSNISSLTWDAEIEFGMFSNLHHLAEQLLKFDFEVGNQAKLQLAQAVRQMLHHITEEFSNASTLINSSEWRQPITKLEQLFKRFGILLVNVQLFAKFYSEFHNDAQHGGEILASVITEDYIVCQEVVHAFSSDQPLAPARWNRFHDAFQNVQYFHKARLPGHEQFNPSEIVTNLKQSCSLKIKQFLDNSTTESNCCELLTQLQKLSNVAPIISDEIGLLVNNLFQQLSLNKGKSYIQKVGLNLQVHPSAEANEVLNRYPAMKSILTKMMNETMQTQDIDYVLSNIGLADKYIDMYQTLYSEYGTFYDDCFRRAFACHTQQEALILLQDSLKQLTVSTNTVRKIVYDFFFGRPDPPKRFPTKFEKSLTNILAHICCIITVHHASDRFGGSDEAAPDTQFLLRVHPAQVITIMRLVFGQSSSKSRPKPENHLCQVKTGEGKSIIMAVTAAIYALAGFEIDCACYNPTLSVRDWKAFEFLFESLGVKKMIKYGTFNQLCEGIVKDKLQVRDQVRNLILKQTDDVAPAPESDSKGRILFIDEVDVFFKTDFYGQTYTPVTRLQHPTITALMKFIWGIRTNKSLLKLQHIKTQAEYSSLTSVFSEWTNLMDEAIKLALMDVQNIDSTPEHEVKFGKIYHFDKSTQRAVDNIVYGYQTTFLYLQELENGKLSEEEAEAGIAFNFNAGDFSYAELPRTYSMVLGVTGTLRELTSAEQKVVQSYDINAMTYMPSVFGVTSADFMPQRDVKVFEDSEYYVKLSNRVDEIIQVKRCALVFFKDLASLEEAKEACSAIVDRDGFQILDHTITDISTRDQIISRSTRAGAVLFALRSDGRGTDFKIHDPVTKNEGGSVVIQTFLASDAAEQTQIMGRTARQGDRGAFCMYLKKVDVMQSLGVSEEELNEAQVTGLWQFLTDRRDALFEESYSEAQKAAIIAATQHEQSTEFFKAVVDANKSKVSDMLFSMNRAPAEHVQSRILVLLDVTGSMSTAMTQTKAKLRTMFQRASDILEENNMQNSGFEMQLGVFRNYNSSAKDLFQVSEWCKDPRDILKFLDPITVSGGWGRNEAVEVGFQHANKIVVSGGQVSTIILIGDAAPNSRAEVDQKRSRRGQSYWSATDFDAPAYSDEEIAKLAASKIPVNTFYVARYPKTSFEEIALATGGQSLELNLQDNSSDALTDAVTKTILQTLDQGGAGLVAQYDAKYGKKGYV